MPPINQIRKGRERDYQREYMREYRKSEIKKTEEQQRDRVRKRINKEFKNKVLMIRQLAATIDSLLKTA